MLDPKILDLFRVAPGTKVRLRDHDPAWAGTREMKRFKKDELKEKAKALLQQNIQELAEAQELLYADDTYSILILFQAMDAAGKDGTIKHVMSGLNPQGCQVFSFKHPSYEELDHNFLWRYYRCLPERGRIGIFNRSYYEEVLIVKVHSEILDKQRLPPGKREQAFWDARYEDINAMERHLTRNGTVILKFFLHLSHGEQKKRFLERLDNPEKNWKFSAADIEERAYWDRYMKAYEDALSATSTAAAPWHIIPADHKWVTRTLVAEFITSAIRGLDLKYPQLAPEERARLKEARKKLEAE